MFAFTVYLPSIVAIIPMSDLFLLDDYLYDIFPSDE